MIFQNGGQSRSGLIIEDNKSRDPKKYWKVNINCFCSVPIDHNSPAESLARSGSPLPLIFDFRENPWKSLDFAKFHWFSKIGGKSDPVWLSRITIPRIRKKYWKVNINCFSSVPIDQNAPAESLARSGSPHPLILDFHENPWKSLDFAKFNWFSKIEGGAHPIRFDYRG